jgi:hypothetical protein
MTDASSSLDPTEAIENEDAATKRVDRRGAATDLMSLRLIVRHPILGSREPLVRSFTMALPADL